MSRRCTIRAPLTDAATRVASESCGGRAAAARLSAAPPPARTRHAAPERDAMDTTRMKRMAGLRLRGGARLAVCADARHGEQAGRLVNYDLRRGASATRRAPRPAQPAASPACLRWEEGRVRPSARPGRGSASPPPPGAVALVPRLRRRAPPARLSRGAPPALARRSVRRPRRAHCPPRPSCSRQPPAPRCPPMGGASPSRSLPLPAALRQGPAQRCCCCPYQGAKRLGKWASGCSSVLRAMVEGAWARPLRTFTLPVRRLWEATASRCATAARRSSSEQCTSR